MTKYKIWKVGCKELLAELNVNKYYESTFYHRPMPIISDRRCKKILNGADKMYVVVENEKGVRWGQYLHKNGTILIG